ncbi:hypothetical protein [Pleionea sp. CnH1-48]|uniref:hypothetical protein n=1 Tax=Pleionea sp. CnH1-48 TaxID=2954494 RepID=UPI0020985A27|nr:hypothetical protein [Pleionea sp. CnH1-48]MCO7224525.1 hypothetical protein [Pleionea sp. CnH1-48]
MVVAFEDIDGDASRLSENRRDTGHHQVAYKALLKNLNGQEDPFKRRQTLDLWLRNHHYSLWQGEQWEQAVSCESHLDTLDWRQEYMSVVRQALINGFFYSDAFQQRLYNTYVEPGRIGADEIEWLNLHAREHLAKPQSGYKALWVCLITLLSLTPAAAAMIWI